MSVGFSNPIGGSNVAFNIFTLDKKSRGGAIRGWMPQAVQTTDKRYTEFEQTRVILKNAWNTSYQTQLKRKNLTKSITTPFRAVNNSGDLLSRQNSYLFYFIPLLHIVPHTIRGLLSCCLTL